MFANFIYFIIALLILALYEPPDEIPLTLGQALVAFLTLSALYAIYTRFSFQRLIRRKRLENSARLDHHFTQLSTRCAILALILLTIDIWCLHLPAFLRPIHWLAMLPTLSSLLFLLLFVGYLTIMWVFSYDAHKNIYRTDITRGNYVYSNLAFSVPILIPWVLLFGITDIIQLLPFEIPKRIVNDPMGQIVYFLIFLVVAAIFAPLLIQRFWRCRSMASGPHRSRIEALCQKAGIRYADIVYWPIFGGRMITAGVMGLVARFRYILVTDALINTLLPEEVDQVIAHEVGHVKRRHLPLYLLFFTGFMLISYAAYPVSAIMLFFKSPILQVIKFFELNPFALLSTVYAFILVISVIVYFRYIFGFFMRNFERQADVYVFELFSSAQPLISTFDKIVLSSGQPADKPNWHHFSIQQRVDYLKRCEKSPEWINRQHRKVNKSILAFVVSFMILAFGAFQLNQLVFNTGSRHINVRDLESYLDHKENKTVEDSLYYSIIGNVYLARQNPERAASAYDASILLNPNNPDTLNNLAWLLTGSESPALANPSRALELARKAINLKKAPYIWDTLAEAFYVNGRTAEAVDAENQALLMNPEGRQNYENQLAKFKAALHRMQ
jgi:Zn-dependent protease with chaperone function